MHELLLIDFSITPAILGVALLLGLLSPLVGVFLVMRRFSLLADTLAHVSLLGVALATCLHLPASAGAFVAAVAGGASIELFRQTRRVLSEATLAIFLSGSLALAVLIFALLGIEAEEMEGYLFGDLALVTGPDFWFLAVVALALLAFFLVYSRQLFLATIDEDLARVNGVSVRGLNLVFMFLAATVVAAASKVVGVLLVSALIVLPVMAALQWRLGFKSTLLLALVFSEGAVGAGFALASGWQFPSGAAIALVSLILFLGSYVVNLWRK